MWLKRLFCKHNLVTFKYSCCSDTINYRGKKLVPVHYYYKCNRCGKLLEHIEYVEEVPQK